MGQVIDFHKSYTIDITLWQFYGDIHALCPTWKLQSIKIIIVIYTYSTTLIFFL